MTEPHVPLRHISDTARWVAVYRARETERPDGLFRDPYAQRLAGSLGEKLASALAPKDRDDWPFVIRTVLFDQFIKQEITAGADIVINLAAGLDARPYRLELPPNLHWIEVDLPEIIDYKTEVLGAEQPRCRLERVKLDLQDVGARAELFERIGQTAANALIITEGLIVYLTANEVAELARELSSQIGFRHWVTDLASPGLLRMLSRQRIGKALDRAEMPLQFGPLEGPHFFERFGWRPIKVCSNLHEAARRKRGPVLLRFFALFPPDPVGKPNRPWSGICLLGRT